MKRTAKKVKNNLCYSELYNSCPVGYSSINNEDDASEDNASEDNASEDDASEDEDNPMYNQFKPTHTR